MVLVMLLMELVLKPISPVILFYLLRLLSLKASALTPIGTVTYAIGYYLNPLISHAAILSSLNLIIPLLLPSIWDLPPWNYVPIPIPLIPSGSLTLFYPIALITPSIIHSIYT